MCNIHLDDATAAILRQNAHHTPAYWWRRDRVMKPISVWGWLGGHDGQRPMGKFGQDAWGYIPTLFRRTSWDFLWPQSGPRFNVSSEGQTLWVLTVLAQKITWFRNDALFNRLFSVRTSDVRSEKKHQDSAWIKRLTSKALKQMQIMYFCECE